MAWVEQCGNRSWRVRYRRDDGTIGALHGFTTKTAATEHANTLEADQREGRFLDPAAGKITLNEWSRDWLEALDVAIRTEDVYRSLLRRHILPRWGEHGLVDISGIKAAAWAKDRRLLPAGGLRARPGGGWRGRARHGCAGQAQRRSTAARVPPVGGAGGGPRLRPTGHGAPLRCP